jgi:hypothetical protein
MEIEKKYIKKRFSFSVNTADESYNKKFDLDKNVRVVKGLLLSSNKPDQLFYRGSQKIEISGQEIFPDEYESRLLMSGLSVPPDNKYADLGDDVQAGNGEVKVYYKDKTNSLAPFDPYDVNMYLVCEIV